MALLDGGERGNEKFLGELCNKHVKNHFCYTTIKCITLEYVQATPLPNI